MKKTIVLFLFCLTSQIQGTDLVPMTVKAVSQALTSKVHQELNPELKAGLLKMQEEDQKGRTAPTNDEAILAVDRAHNPRLKEIINTHGWPGLRLVGIKGASAMWLLVQHQDQDLSFQKTCLDLLKEAVERQDAAFREYAYLYDRVCLNEGRTQLYGTQWIQRDGKYVLYSVEDVENLAHRREQAGLNTIEDYRKQIQSEYGLDDSDFE